MVFHALFMQVWNTEGPEMSPYLGDSYLLSHYNYYISSKVNSSSEETKEQDLCHRNTFISGFV